ncbi:MAG: M1 family metallopeptidase [Rhizomicrobium sp.]
MKRVAGLLLLGVIICLSACGKSAVKPHKPAHGISLRGEIIPLGRLPRIAVPQRYRIALRIDPRTDRFSGHVEIDVNFTKARRALFLHGLGLNVSGVTVRLSSGQNFAAHYDQVDASGVARLIFVDQVPAGRATLIFDYDAPFSAGLVGLYKVEDRGDTYAFTQFETTEARRVFPSFDEPGFKTPFDITVIAPRADRVIGNAPIAFSKPVSNGMEEFNFATTKPLPTYLVALAIGPLDVVDGGVVPPNQFRHNAIHVRGVTARGNGPRIAYALSLTPRLVQALEDYFGVAYPFQKLDVLAVPDFAAGGMENAGAITFRERLLLIDPGAPLEQKRESLAVQAHELAHQWFGDLVTPAWWDDAWLNESFASWMEYKAAAAVLPVQEFDSETLRNGFNVMDLDELPSARQIHQPIQNTGDIVGAFDAITYSKGASVLRMFENYVGPEEWRRGIHAYLTKYASGNATAHDFISTVAETTRHPELVAAFSDFIDQPGVPYLRMTAQCTPPSLDIIQSTYAPIASEPQQRTWRVPVCLAGTSGQNCNLVDRPKLSLPLGSMCTTFPNAEGSGYFRFSLDEKGWETQIGLATHRDPAEQIALVNNVVAALRAGDAMAPDLLNSVHALASTARWDVLQTLSDRLHALRQGLPPIAVADYRRFVANNFGARWKSLGATPHRGEMPGDALLRQYLARLMVSEARDPTALAELSTAARAQLNAGGEITGKLAPELRAEAMRAALIADPVFADALVKMFQTTDSEYVRRDIIYAFAGSDDPATIGKLLALIGSSVRSGELRNFSEIMASEPVASSTLWKYFVANYDMFVRRLTVQRMPRLAMMLEHSCDAGTRTDLNVFFKPRIATMDGGARRLAYINERIERCIAFRKAKGAEVASALSAAR